MKLYSLELSDDFTSYTIKDNDRRLDICEDRIDILSDKWKEKRLTVIDRRKDGDLAFCFNPMNHLLISQSAADLLNDYLDFEEVELLPVKKGKEKFYILHGIKAHKLTVEIVKKGIQFHHIFQEEELKECGIDEMLFIKAEMGYGVLSDLFFTEKFVNLVKELNLQGVEFEVEWDSEVNCDSEEDD